MCCETFDNSYCTIEAVSVVCMCNERELEGFYIQE